MDNDFYRQILDELYDGVYFVDLERRITYWNRGAERISGYPAAEVMGRRCADSLLMHVDDDGVVLCQQGCPLTATMADGELREVQVYMHHANGHRAPVRVRVAPIYDEQGRISGAVESFSDNSLLVDALRQARNLASSAMQDALTGVGNRRFTEMHLQSALDNLRHFHVACGVIFLDIDKFKEINDHLGHAAGDRALCMLADTLRANLRATDLVGRWGGDEFVIILPDASMESLVGVAHKLRSLVERSQFNWKGPDGDEHAVQITISVGATLVTPEDTLETLVQRADQLMYQSKGMGRNKVTAVFLGGGYTALGERG
jgi:diguanylate cyclase (GGDEF)-like protein/PAS domain S-box-containing protein